MTPRALRQLLHASLRAEGINPDVLLLTPDMEKAARADDWWAQVEVNLAARKAARPDRQRAAKAGRGR